MSLFDGTIPSMPPWLSLLLAGVYVLYIMVLGGILLGRTGRHPMWALCLILPYLHEAFTLSLFVFLFWLAYTKWPKVTPISTEN